MKSTYIILSIIIGSLFFSTSIIAQQTNLSGNWTLNAQKSIFGDVPLFVAKKQITITQTADSVLMKGILVDQDGKEIKGAMNYALDGKKTMRAGQDSLRQIGSFEYAAETKKFIRTQSFVESEKPEIVVRTIGEIWSLSTDGKTLTIVQSVKQSAGDYSFTAVYDKQ